MKANLVLVAGLFTLVASARVQGAPGDSVYAAAAAALVDSYKGSKPPARVEELSAIYRRLRLLDGAGHLVLAGPKGSAFRGALGRHETELLASFDPAAEVQRILGCARQNPYLNDVMADLEKAVAGGTSYPFVKLAAAPEGAHTLRQVLAYSVALDRVGVLVRNDWHALAELHARYLEVRADPSFSKRFAEVANLFERAKVLTVDPAITAYLEYLATHKVPVESGRLGLAVNIAEAALEDTRLGFRDNASAAVTLMVRPVGNRELVDPKTFEGPSRMSKDNKAILWSPPLPEKWADLYSTWNLAFVSHYPNFPFFFAKLLNPDVLCYHHLPDGERSSPSEYVFHRVISLYLHIHFEILGRMDQLEAKSQPPVAWNDDGFTRLWAARNHQSAQAYACLVPHSAELARQALEKKAGEVAEKACELKTFAYNSVCEFADFAKSCVFVPKPAFPSK